MRLRCTRAFTRKPKHYKPGDVFETSGDESKELIAQGVAELNPEDESATTLAEQDDVERGER